MSLERFRVEYNIPNLRQVISLEKARQFSEMSDAEYLAMRFAEIGSEGIREAIDQSDRNNLEYSYGMVVVGTALEYAADTAKRGVFRKPEYVIDYNYRARGGRFNLLYSDSWDVQVLENKQWEQMIRFVEENPSLSAFFTTGLHLMPNFVRSHVGQSINIEAAQKYIIRPYHSIVSKLLIST